MAGDAMAKDGGSYKWTMLALVSGAYFLAQGARQIYSTVLPHVRADFASAGLSDAQLGLVGSVFTLVFGLVIPFAGLAADFFRRKWMVVLGALVFSIGVLSSGFATGIGFLIVSYGILNGMGQSLMPPSNSSLIGQFHVETRGTAFSIYQAAIYLGTATLGVVAGLFVAHGHGWRWAFWTFGAIGVAFAFALAALLRDTPPPVSSGEGRPRLSEAVGAFFGKPTALLLMAALGAYFFAIYGVKLWTPAFITRISSELGTPLSPTAVAFHSVFWFYVGAFAGALAGGRVSDRLRRTRKAVRLEVEIAGALLCVPFALALAYAPNLVVLCAALLCFGFATGVYDSNLYAALLDVVDPRYRAAATGVFGCGGCVIGAFGPAVMGWMNGAFSYRTSMASLALFALVAAALVLVAHRSTFARDRVSD